MANQINQRPISEGRNVSLQDFPVVVSEFERMGWSPFLSVLGSIFPPLVYQFYEHFEFINRETVNFRMFGHQYSYSLSQFGALLGISSEPRNYPNIPPEQMYEYLCRVCVPFRTIVRTGILDDYLRPEIVIRAAIVRSNIYHRDADDDVVCGTEASVLWCVGHNIQINTARFVAARMNMVNNGRVICLPYGSLLNRLFSRIGVLHGPIRSHQISTLPINRASFPDTDSADEISIVPEASSSSSGSSSTGSDARSRRR